MMDITMLLTVLAPIGGIESALTPLAQELQRQGHRVRLYVVRAPAMPNQNVASLRQVGIPIAAAPRPLVWLTDRLLRWRPALSALLLTLAAPLLLLAALLDALRRRRPWRRSWQGACGVLRGHLSRLLALESWYYAPLRRLWRTQGLPAVVHVHGWGCGEDPRGAIAWLRQFPVAVVYTEHNSPDPAIHTPIPAAPMNRADLLIAVSAAGRQGLITVGGAIPPIAVIPYPVTPLPVLASPAAEIFTMTCIARLMPQKGHADLLHACAQLAAQGLDLRLLLAGDGPLRQELTALAARLQLTNQVQFLGVVPHAELPALLARSDLIVLPSYWEGMPLALIEALSVGKPIVASAVGGNPEIVHHGENGLLVPPGDVPALVAALHRMAQLPRPERLAFGAASRHRFQTGGFDTAAVASNTIAAYQQALNLASSRQSAARIA